MKIEKNPLQKVKNEVRYTSRRHRRQEYIDNLTEYNVKQKEE